MTQDVVKQIAALAKAGVPANAIAAILAGMNDVELPKARGRGRKAKSSGRPFGQKWSAEELAERDQEILTAFTRKGFRNVILKDRNDPTKDYNVRTFGRPATVDAEGKPVPATGWLGVGRVVRKGEKSVKYGLFHVTQTDELPKTN